jgi:hypothetical protein
MPRSVSTIPCLLATALIVASGRTDAQTSEVDLSLIGIGLDVAGPTTLSGPVTINHSAPTESLDVDGAILARGRLLAGYPNRFFWADPTQGFVGIGRSTQVTGSEIFGTYKDTGAFSGMYIQTGPLGEPFYGYSAGGDIDAYHYYDGDDPSWKLNLNNTIVTRIDASTGEAFFSGDLVVAGGIDVGGSIDIGYEIVENTKTSNGGSESVGVSCPAGKKVLGGGCFGAGNNDKLDTSSPSLDTGWNCFWSDTDNDFSYRARAICANVR